MKEVMYKDYHIYGKWEYFYFDEKGKQNDYKIFSNENDACASYYSHNRLPTKHAIFPKSS